MKRKTAPWVRKAEDDLAGARKLSRMKPPLRDLVCFHCQQCAEKYLKALHQELSIPFPKTHDLDTLLTPLLASAPELKALRKRLDALTSFAVEYRYPIVRARTRQMHSALRTVSVTRAVIRKRLGLS
jgi:HEPN domain-containing protein